MFYLVPESFPKENLAFGQVTKVKLVLQIINLKKKTKSSLSKLGIHSGLITK